MQLRGRTSLSVAPLLSQFLLESATQFSPSPGLRWAHVSRPTVYASRVNLSASSATVAGYRFGPVQDLFVQTVEAWGTHFLQLEYVFRYALTLELPRLFILGNSDMPRIRFPRGFLDVLVFLIILVKIRRPRIRRYPGMPILLDTLLRDATHYFVLICSVHFLSLLFLFVTSVCGT